MKLTLMAVILVAVTTGLAATVAPTADDVNITVVQGKQVRIPFSGADPDGDLFGFQVTSGLSNPAAGTLDVVCHCVASAGGGELCDCTAVFTASTTFTGITTFTYRAVDSSGLTSAPAVVTITVVSAGLSLEEEIARFNQLAARFSATIDRLFANGFASNPGIPTAINDKWSEIVTLINEAASAALGGDFAGSKAKLGLAIRRILHLGDFLANQHLVNIVDDVPQELLGTANDIASSATTAIGTFIDDWPAECGATKPECSCESKITRSDGFISGFVGGSLDIKVTFGWATDDTNRKPHSFLYPFQVKHKLPLGTIHKPNPDKPGKLLQPESLEGHVWISSDKTTERPGCSHGKEDHTHSFSLADLQKKVEKKLNDQGYFLPPDSSSADIKISPDDMAWQAHTNIMPKPCDGGGSAYSITWDADGNPKLKKRW